jgi:hypothetical protein
MSKVEFYADKGARYQPFRDIIVKIKADDDLQHIVNSKTHDLSDEIFAYEDLCWELAEYQLIFEKGYKEYNESEINHRAKKILDSKLNYGDICWLISSFKSYLKQHKLYP